MTLLRRETTEALPPIKDRPLPLQSDPAPRITVDDPDPVTVRLLQAADRIERYGLLQNNWFNPVTGQACTVGAIFRMHEQFQKFGLATFDNDPVADAAVERVFAYLELRLPRFVDNRYIADLRRCLLSDWSETYGRTTQQVVAVLRATALTGVPGG